MDVNFRFSRIEIENFRGLKGLAFELPDDGPLAIVGPNNADKSTILDAIAMAMEGPSAHNFSPDEHDYYCKRDGEREKTFTIRLRFAAAHDQELPAVRGAVGSPEPVRGAIVVGKTDKSGNHSHRSALMGWAHRHGVDLVHIQPGNPTQNAYIERFNRTYRTEVLDRYVFTSLPEVRRMTEDWRHRYNHHRPHRSLAGLTPAAFARAQSPSTSTSE